MASTTERLAILITADGKGAIRELQLVGKATEKSLGDSAARSDRLAASFTKIGVAAVAGTAVAAVGLYKLGQAASNLEQAVGGTEAIFGDAASTVQDFGKTSADAFGISETAALSLATATGGLLKGFGYTKDAAAETSVSLLKLGADLSATFGGTTTQAVEALGSALKGEFNPLEQFGTSLTAAQVALRAVEMGLAASTSKVDANAKAQATLSLIMERTADAQGQFGREADTAAGQQARLAASFQDLKANIGQGVLPVMTQLVGGLNAAVGAFGNLDPAVQSTVGKVLAIGTATAGLVGAVALGAGAMAKMRDVFITTERVGGVLQDKLTGVGKAAVGLGAIGATIAALQVLDSVMESMSDHAGKADAALESLLGSKSSTAALKDFQELGRQIDSSRGTMEEAGAAIKDLFGGDSRGAANMEAFKRVLAESVPQAQRLVDAMSSAGWDPKIVDRYREALEKKKAADVQGTVDQQKYSQSVRDAAAAQSGAVGSAGSLASGVAGAGDAAGVASDQFYDLADAISAALGGQLSSQSADLAFAESLDNVAQAQDEVGASGVRAAGGTSAAGKSAIDAERATRSYEDALRGVEEAQRGVEDAARGVEDAARGVEDAHRAEADAAQAVVDAQQGVVEAQRDVAEANRAVADSARGVGEAQRRVADSALALDDAQRGVVEAQRKVVDSAYAVEEAQRGVVDAQRKSGDATKKLADEQLKLQQIVGGFGSESTEGMDAGEKAAAAQRDQRRAALGVVDAQKRLAAAQAKATDAQSDYAEGSVEIADANRDVERAQLDLEEAQAGSVQSTEDAAAAQKALTTTVGGFGAASKEAAAQTRAVAGAQRESEDAARGVTEASRDVESAQLDLAEANRGVGEASREVEDRQLALEASQRGVEKASRDLEGAHRRVIDAERGVRDATREVEDRQRALIDSHRNVGDATRDVERANRDLEAAVRGVDDANFHVREAEDARTQGLTGGGGGGGAHGAVRNQISVERDLQQALIDTKQKFLDAGEAAGEAALQQEALRRGIDVDMIPAQERMIIKTDAQKRKLEELISTLDPNSPLRQQLQGYIDAYDNVPSAVDTAINLDTGQARNALSAFASAMRAGAAFAGGNLPGASEFITKINDAVARMANARGDSYVPGLAAGGPARAGHLYEVGEGGRPELFQQGGKLYMIPGNNGQVIPASTDGAAGSGVNINGPIVLGHGGPRELARELGWMIRTTGRAA